MTQSQVNRLQGSRTCRQSHDSSISTPTFFPCFVDKQAGSTRLALNANAASLEETGRTLEVDVLARTFLSNC